MLYRKLGRTGLKVSGISLGSWRTFGLTVDDATTQACMVAAYESGINFFDGAEAYGDGAAERAMGKAFKACAWPRDTYCVSSKVISVGSKPTQRGLSRKHLVKLVMPHCCGCTKTIWTSFSAIVPIPTRLLRKSCTR